MLESDLLLFKDNECISVRSKDKWVLFNPNNQVAVVADDRTINVLLMLETPKYYGELELECLNSYSDLDSDGFSKSIKHLIDSRIILVNNDGENNTDSLTFNSYPEIPKIIAVHPTYKCNLNCKYCYNMDIRTVNAFKERSKAEWKQLLLSLQERGVNRFDITGGEPLLRVDLFPIYKELKNRGSQVELITNGTLIDSKGIANNIAESFSRVTVSFDSYDCREHELYRGEGTHAIIIDAMKYLTDAQVSWQAKGVLTADNASSVKRTKKFVMDLGGHDYAVSIMVGAAFDSELIYEQYYNAGIRDRVNEGNTDFYEIPDFDFNQKYGIPCSAARQDCAIDPDGGVFPCRVFMSSEMYCGNVFDTEIAEIWKNSEILKTIRNIDYKKIDNCGHCSFLRMCLGGCRAIAYMESGYLLSGLNSFACTMRKRRINTIINRHALKALESNEEEQMKRSE